MLENNDKYFEVLSDTKKTLLTTRNKIIESANKDLKMEFSTLKGMSARNLRYMQKFATEFDKIKDRKIRSGRRNNLLEMVGLHQY